MKRLVFFLLLLSSFFIATAQPYVNACISVNGTPQTGPSPKSVWVCRGTAVTLSGNNCITPPNGYNPIYLSYSWQYLKYPSTTFTYNTQNRVTLDSGRWVLTVRYFDNVNGINVLDRDTVWIKFYGTSIRIAQKNSAGIAIKCATDSILLTSTILPASASGTVSNYQWFVAGTSTILSTTDRVKVKNASFYVVSADESTYGCRIRDTVLVSNYASPLVNIGQNRSICTGNSVTLSSSVTPGINVSASAWFRNGTSISTGGAIAGNVFPPSTVASTAGTYVLQLRAQGTGCLNSDTVVVSLQPGANFTLSDTTICFYDDVQLIPNEISVLPPVNYSWSPSTYLNNASIKDPVCNPTIAGTFTYALTITDANNCPVTKTINVTKYPELISSVYFDDSTICVGNSINLIANTATGGAPFTSGSAYLYTWKDATQTVLGTSLTQSVQVNDASANFYVVVEDRRGCLDSATVAVQTTFPVANLGPDVFAIAGQTVTLDPQSGNAVSFDWYETSSASSLGTTPTLSVTTKGTYAVIVTDVLHNCETRDTASVDFTDGNPELIYIPNAFSPASSDPENQVVKVYGEGLTADGFEFRIYNRWGDLLYSTSDLNTAKSTGWAGPKDNLDNSQQNVYTYAVKGKYITGTAFEKTGTITLLK